MYIYGYNSTFGVEVFEFAGGFSFAQDDAIFCPFGGGDVLSIPFINAEVGAEWSEPMVIRYLDH